MKPLGKVIDNVVAHLRPQMRLLHLRFVSKAEIKRHFKSMLANRSREVRLNDEDYNDLIQLLERHPDAAEKIGCGIEHFRIRVHPDGGNCFHARRLDGSWVHFSYLKALNGKPPTSRQLLITAMRRAIRDQIEQARIFALSHQTIGNSMFRCAGSNRIVPIENAHIDHIPPDTFKALTERFCETYGVSIEAVEMEDIRTECYEPRQPRDQQLIPAWQEFHREHAKLRLVDAAFNLKGW